MNLEALLFGDMPIDIILSILQRFTTMQVSKLLDGHALMLREQLDQVLRGGPIARWHEAVAGGGSGMVACDLVD
jgi:hypothetical protein